MSQFWSHWVTETETTWSDAYKVKDLDIASVDCKQAENNCATLDLLVKNPQVGLLAPGRLIWLWLGWENDAGVTVPIFHGRLIPTPTKQTNAGNAVTLSFLGKPLDFDNQRVLAALALMIPPNYDPVFIDPTKRLTATFNPGTGAGDFQLPPPPGTGGEIIGYTGDPDSVLEGWPRLWSIDRVTGVVDSSDILVGEDGTETFVAAEIPADSVQISVASSILTDVTVVGTVNWTQADDSGGFAVNVAVTSPNGLDIVSGWPKAGASLAGGYEVKTSFATDILSLGTAQVVQKGWKYENKDKTHQPGDTMSISWNYADWPAGLTGNSYLLSATVQASTPGAIGWDGWSGIGAMTPGDDPNLPFHLNENMMIIAEVPVECGMTVGASSSLGRNETITIKLAADIQPMIILPTSAQTPSAASPISVSGSDVGVPIDGTTPISSGAANNYFPSSRGQQSIDYLIMVGIANLKAANRAISISWDTTFERALALSCRKSATITDPEIPGGTATGKIVAYGFSASGPNLELKGNVTIACCIGNGGDGTVTGTVGGASYAVTGTFVPFVQMEPGTTVVPGAGSGVTVGDVSYSPPVYSPQPGEPSFPLQASQMIVSQGFTTVIKQVNIGSAVSPIDGFPATPITVDVPIQVYNLELLNLSGNFGATYDLTPTPVLLPKQIDLTVPSW